MKSLAIMQPYFFPYLGYFQLVASVDRFVIYDDVSFIKQGWINRNRILLNGEPFFITVPLANASSFILIKDTTIANHQKPKWKQNMLKTIEQAYKKAPYFKQTFPLVERILSQEHATISQLAFASIKEISEELGIATEFVSSSSIYKNETLKGPERVIDICVIEQSTDYVNPPGGRHLYDFDQFERRHINLHFLEARLPQYKQFSEQFVPGLSIIDILMFNSKEQIQSYLHEFSLAGKQGAGSSV